ncbi:MAG: hypothetical protein ACFFA0_01930 [Promethearchaeota archaeon]
MKSYIALNTGKRDFIVAICTMNIVFCVYYLWELLKFPKIFKLENKNIIRFGRRIGCVTLFYLPHLFLITTLFFKNPHNLELIMISLIFIIELLIIGIVLKEVYDLVFLEESRRDFEIEENRKKYIEKEKI